MSRVARTAVASLVAIQGFLIVPGLLSVQPAGAAVRIPVTLSVVAKADDRAALDQAAERQDAVVIRVLRADRDLYLVEKQTLIEFKNIDKDTSDLAERIGKSDGVAWAVESDGSVGGDRFYAWPSGRPSRGQGGVNLATFMDLAVSHELATGQGIRIAVLDTGFDEDHPLLEPVLGEGVDVVDGHPNVGDWLNNVDDDGDGLIDEAHGHGTYVAGVIAQIAPDATIIPIRVLEADGIGSLYSVIDGIDEAIARGADVINISFGTFTDSRALKDAVKRATDAGVVIVAAAGNDGSDVKQYPAAYGGVIAVSAYAPDDAGLAGFGNYGDWIDVSAPGVNIRSSRPGGGMGIWSGSSLAAPIVSGQVALLIELDPKKGRKDAEKLVRKSAVKTNGERRTKEGVIDLQSALAELE